MEENQNGMAPQESVSEQVVEQQPVETSPTVESPEAAADVAKDAPSDPMVAQTPDSQVEDCENPATAEEKKEEENLEAESDRHLDDLQKMGLAELVQHLRGLVEQEMSGALRTRVEDVKSIFYKKVRTLHEEERREWDRLKAEGEIGDEEEFKPSDIAEHSVFQALYNQFRAARKEHQKRVEEEQQENLAAKRKIIEKIQELTTRAEVKDDTYREFKELVKEWGTVGHVPQAEMDDLYKSYQHQIQNFYDYLKINRELRDLDYKKNFDTKTGLCERAEELIVLPDPVEAFRRLQDLHTQWKEIGPVMREKSEEIWERFSAATARINTRHREHFEKLKEGYEANLVKKEALCSRVEEIFAQERKNLRAWYNDSEKITAIQKEWKTIGPVPRKHNTQIWNRFQTICEQFFTTRRAVEKEVRAEGQVNIQKKLDLCAQAEALKDSTDWAATAREMKALQAKWKEVGSTPHKRGEELWKRFRTAMDFFFEQRNQSQASVRDEQKENLQQKEALIKELTEYQPSDDAKASLDWLKDIQHRWGEIGFVPFKQKESIQTRYREQLDRLYDALRIDRREQNFTDFKSRVEDMADGGAGSNVLSREKSRLNTRLRALEGEKRQLETNLSFVRPSGDTNPILDHLQSQVEKLDQDIALMRDKVKLIDQKVREERAGKEAKKNAAETKQEDKPEGNAE